jgi:hypothetical protein
MIAPFVANGDTGLIFHQLGFPMRLIILIALFGGAMVFFLGKFIGKNFAEMGSEETSAVR